MTTNYILIPAALKAECPRCGAVVTVSEGTYAGTVGGDCSHYLQVERIDQMVYVRFEDDATGSNTETR